MPRQGPRPTLVDANGDCSECGQRHVRIVKAGPGSGHKGPHDGTPHEVPTCSGHVKTDRDSYVPGQNRKPLDKPRPCRRTRPSDEDPAWKCWMHGGATPLVIAKRERDKAEAAVIAAARKLIPDLDERTPITNPLERLLELASEADAFRESLRTLANKLGDDIRYRGAGAGAEQLRAEVATYQQAFKQTTDMLVAIARLDIEHILARVESRKVEMTIEALNHGCDDAGLNAEQKRTVMAGVARHLRSVPRRVA